MNNLWSYIISWIISFFLPFGIYYAFNLLKKEVPDEKSKMPFLNKFSIILLSIFATMNCILFHLISTDTYLLGF